jgi:hypothetical protein
MKDSSSNQDIKNVKLFIKDLKKQFDIFLLKNKREKVIHFINSNFSIPQ